MHSLRAAEDGRKAGYAFGMGLGSTGNSTNNTGCMSAAFGASLVDAKGEINVNANTMNTLLKNSRAQTVEVLPPGCRKL